MLVASEHFYTVFEQRSIRECVRFLEGRSERARSKYQVNLVCYFLSLAGSSRANAVCKRMKTSMTRKGELRKWQAVHSFKFPSFSLVTLERFSVTEKLSKPGVTIMTMGLHWGLPTATVHGRQHTLFTTHSYTHIHTQIHTHVTHAHPRTDGPCQFIPMLLRPSSPNKESFVDRLSSVCICDRPVFENVSDLFFIYTYRRRVLLEGGRETKTGMSLLVLLLILQPASRYRDDLVWSASVACKRGVWINRLSDALAGWAEELIWWIPIHTGNKNTFFKKWNVWLNG